ncbi:MAG: SIS domain-containing protein [Nitrospiraceae bacterium]|nr:SIS domain-containing protein [Nitrospiraceae bacterium]
MVTGADGKATDFAVGVDAVIDLILSLREGCKVMFIGNGGSAAISSHMAVDFWKNGRIRAVAFNDSSLLTCVGNDCGYDNIFEKPIEMFADGGDILFAISSSGRSENILRGVRAARTKDCKVVTLSGFDNHNPLTSMGDYNFYVPSHAYGPVEVIHHSICHCILDAVIRGRGGRGAAACNG